MNTRQSRCCLIVFTLGAFCGLAGCYEKEVRRTYSTYGSEGRKTFDREGTDVDDSGSNGQTLHPTKTRAW